MNVRVDFKRNAPSGSHFAAQETVPVTMGRRHSLKETLPMPPRAAPVFKETLPLPIADVTPTKETLPVTAVRQPLRLAATSRERRATTETV